MIKLMHFAKRNKSLSHEEFVKHYREVHVPMALDLWKANKRAAPKKSVAYLLNETPDMPYDLIVEQWYEDEDHLKRTQEYRKSPAFRRMREDIETLTDRDLGRSICVPYEEYIII